MTENFPIWAKEIPEHLDPFPAHLGQRGADVVVIGAGIAGLSAAYMLSLRGLSVMVLECAAPGDGMTGRSTAHLTTALDDGWRALVKKLGTARAALAAKAYQHAIETIAKIQAEEGIACDFARVDGFLVGKTSQRGELEEELLAAQAAGLCDIDWSEPPFGDGLALRFPSQARLHPQKYLNGLARAVRRRGGRIYRAKALRLEGYVAPITVITNEGFATATRAVVFAKNVFEDFPGLSLKQETYRSYVVAASIPKGTARDAVCWDLEDPYHYTRLQPGPDSDDGNDILIAGGEDHPADEERDPAKAFAKLEAWVGAQFPAAGRVFARWPGELKQTPDNLGYMGRAAKGMDVYLIDGDGGLGFNHATIGGLILGDLIAGGSNPWEGIFDPRRNS
jgi:glycine/D-amino acid oxidase-like deaminating enzyme